MAEKDIPDQVMTEFWWQVVDVKSRLKFYKSGRTSIVSALCSEAEMPIDSSCAAMLLGFQLDLERYSSSSRLPSIAKRS